MIGILKTNITSDEEMLMFNEINKTHDLCLFTDSFITTVYPRLNVYQLVEAFHFKGSIITDEIECLLQLKNCNLSDNHYYYCTSPEWSGRQNLTLDFMLSTLLGEDRKGNPIRILAKSTELNNILENLNLEPEYLSETWDSAVSYANNRRYYE